MTAPATPELTAALSRVNEEEVGRSGADEEWRSVPGYEGLYEASSLGRIRSLYRGDRILSANGTDESGYPVVSLSRGGERRTYTLHRLVCRAFHGESRPVHREVAHLDGDRKNARADNLRWVSKIENRFHMIGHQTRLAGERHPSAKLTPEQVAEIRLAVGNRINGILGRKYGVHKDTIGLIRRGKTWRS